MTTRQSSALALDCIFPSRDRQRIGNASLLAPPQWSGLFAVMKKYQALGASISLAHATISTWLIMETLRYANLISFSDISRYGSILPILSGESWWWWWRWWGPLIVMLILVLTLFDYSLELWSIYGRRLLDRTSFGGLKEFSQSFHFLVDCQLSPLTKPVRLLSDIRLGATSFCQIRFNTWKWCWATNPANL